MVEQIWRVHKEYRMPQAQPIIGHGGSQMGFATPISSLKEQPPFRIFSIILGCFIRYLEVALFIWCQPMSLGEKCFKRASLKQSQLAHALQIILPVHFLFGDATNASLGSPKTGMDRRHIWNDVTKPAAVGTISLA